MSCNNRESGPCCPDTPYPQVSPESVPSLIDNLVYALYGVINKSVVNGRVVWDIPCDPNNTAEIDQIPREEGEGLLCYLIRAFNDTIATPFLRWAFTGNGTLTSFSLTNAILTNRNGYLAYIDGVVQDPINYTISATSPKNIVFTTAIPNSSILTVIQLQPARSIQGATGPSGGPIGATGATGVQGLTGATGIASPAGGIRWAYNGNGTQTAFSVTGAISTLATAFLVAIDGILQDPDSYTITGTTLTMSQAVPNGSEIVIVSINGIQGATGPSGGPTGATGATGSGATGVQGLTGATGIASPAGGIRWAYNGNGTQTAFSVTGAISTLATAFLVAIDGILQDPNNYSITGTTLTMLQAVPNGSEIVIVSINGIQGITGATGVRGSTGATGSGATGATGVQGLTGATGSLPPSIAGNVWTFNGNGATTTWTLTGNTSGSLVSALYIAQIDGIIQAPANYTINNVSPRTLTISTVPTGSSLVVVSLSTA